ncbi:MAG TPA: glycoside hydrolase family 2 TIM barrel-domain containing protein, partial [Bacillales bacterium]|nr:glycoside hydrolase family 2 TIM barrel-domain containing protein [Bacillales bacterium]
MRNEYPRPQFVREAWMNLNGEWDFAFDDGKVGVSEKWYKKFPEARTILVPFAYQTKKSGINDPAFHDVVWYHRTFDLSDAWKNQNILLHFGAVDYQAQVYVNGELAARHEGGHVSFSTDITHLISEKDNHVVVRAEDPSKDVTIPRGKQYWHERSASIFYTRTTGIWQTVWLEPVSPVHIDSIRWTPQIDRGDVDAEFEVNDFNGQQVEVTVDISFKGVAVVSDRIQVQESYTKRSFNLRNRIADRSNIHGDGWYWTPSHPNLFDVTVTLKVDGHPVDRIESYFGMRKVSIDQGKFMLNNRPFYQKLVLDQGYFPEGLLTAPSDDDLKQDIVLAKEMGFNGARKHQKVEDPRYLYWADKLGFLVWGEMASCSEYSEDAARRMSSEWSEVIRRDYNHPCIVTWVPINESWGVSRIAIEEQQQSHSLAMYYLTKSLDTTRPVLSNDGWEHTVSDMLGIHNYHSADALREAYETVDTAVSTTPASRQIYANGFSY